jgi:hypothetical protein
MIPMVFLKSTGENCKIAQVTSDRKAHAQAKACKRAYTSLPYSSQKLFSKLPRSKGINFYQRYLT